MIKLNAGQQATVNGIVSGILENKEPGFTVIGEGGTGKTTCIMFAAQEYLNAGLKVLFCAPTNKAVKQLEKSARSFGLAQANVAFMTLHKALGLAMLPNEENKWAVQVSAGVLELFDVVVVDEASMLSKVVLASHLIPRATTAALILMGDDMQLPPVKEDRSLAFDLFPTYRLVENERQGEDSEIKEVTGLLRTAIENEKPFKHPDEVGGAVEVVQAAKFMEEVVNAFDSDTDLDGQRVLAWSNRRVDEINARIRIKLFGKKCDPYVVGERVVTGAPIREDGELILSTGEECIVEAVQDSYVLDEETGEEYKTRMLVLQPLHAPGGQVFAQVIHETEVERYKDRLNALAGLAKKNPTAARTHWAKFHEFKELFDTIKYVYCMTVHQSQGSTFDTIYVDTKDLLRNRIRKERQRLLYVAYSRPRHRLVINRKSYVA